MKHYRILEKKNKSKEYIIQYLKPIFFGFQIWKNINKTFSKYDDALNEIKKVIKNEDYDNSTIGYHYVDAYKFFKIKEQKPTKELLKVSHTNIESPIEKIEDTIINQSVVDNTHKTPKKENYPRKNRSVFVPKN